MNILCSKKTHANIGGVLSIESILKLAVQSNSEGHIGNAWFNRSSLTITSATPDVPIFFWAPAYITPNYIIKDMFYYNRIRNKLH